MTFEVFRSGRPEWACRTTASSTSVSSDSQDSVGVSPRFLSLMTIEKALRESTFETFLHFLVVLLSFSFVFSSHHHGSILSLFFDGCFPQDDDVTGEMTMRSRVAINANTPWQKWRVARPDRPAVWFQAFRKTLQNSDARVLGRFVQAFVSSLGADVLHAPHFPQKVMPLSDQVSWL